MRSSARELIRSSPLRRSSLMSMRLNNPALLAIIGLAIAAVLAGLFLGRAVATPRSDAPQSENNQTAHTTAAPAASSDAPPHESFPIFINRPSGPPRIDTGLLDDLGRAVTVSCASCHSNLQPNIALRSGDELREFHQGLHFAHGDLTCLSCHNADNYNLLRLADGSALAYEHVMNLCSQCHVPQARDFARGAHGGMTGYWDLSRGPQHRKNCIDCHDPHAPAFPSMIRTFKPRDRFLDPPKTH